MAWTDDSVVVINKDLPPLSSLIPVHPQASGKCLTEQTVSQISACVHPEAWALWGKTESAPTLLPGDSLELGLCLQSMRCSNTTVMTQEERFSLFH